MIRQISCISLFVLLFTILASNASAQSSIFSGLADYGSMERYVGSRAAGLGDAGIALDDSSAINFLNPALLGCLNKTRFSAGGYMSSRRMRDSYASDGEDWAQIEQFGLAIALKRGLGLGVYVLPGSRIDYRYVWDVQIDGSTYIQSYQGKGGLSKIGLNLGWAFTPWGQIGFGGFVNWGEVEESRISYTTASGNDAYIEFLTTKQWLSFGGTVGVLLKPTSKMTLGAIFEPEVPINLDKTFAYSESDSSVVSEEEYRLAATYGVGLSYRFSPQWLLTGQALYSPWSELTDIPSSSYGYQDAYTLGAGAEWKPSGWDSDHLFTRLTYRVGARYETGYALGEDGSSIDGYFATAGIGYPLHKGRDRIDLAVEYGQRGDLSTNGGQESIFKIRVGFNFGETWFDRPKPSWED